MLSAHADRFLVSTLDRDALPLFLHSLNIASCLAMHLTRSKYNGFIKRLSKTRLLKCATLSTLSISMDFVPHGSNNIFQFQFVFISPVQLIHTSMNTKIHSI